MKEVYMKGITLKSFIDLMKGYSSTTVKDSYGNTIYEDTPDDDSSIDQISDSYKDLPIKTFNINQYGHLTIELDIIELDIIERKDFLREEIERYKRIINNLNEFYGIFDIMDLRIYDEELFKEIYDIISEDNPTDVIQNKLELILPKLMRSGNTDITIRKPTEYKYQFPEGFEYIGNSACNMREFVNYHGTLVKSNEIRTKVIEYLNSLDDRDLAIYKIVGAIYTSEKKFFRDYDKLGG